LSNLAAMTCSNCGRQNPPAALYCLDCGQKLREPSQPVQPAAPFAAAMQPGGMQIPETSQQRLPPSSPIDSCPRCGVDNPPGMRFCRMCGSPMRSEQPQVAAPAPAASLPSNCPRCSAPLDHGAAFCGVCGLPASEMMAAAPRPAASSGVQPVAAPAAPAAAPPAAPYVAPAQPAPSVPPNASPAAPIQRPELRTDNYGAEPGVTSARLVTILKDGSEGPVYRITAASTDVGRSEGNILLQEDPYLSPRHARISYRSGRFYLRDLGSVNGIFYRLREPMVLHSGDVVLAGQQVLKLEVLADAEVSLGPVMHYGVMVFGTPDVPRFARLVQLTTEGIPRDVYHLHRDETVIGREQGDIVFTDDAFLSRRHAALKIERAQKRISIRDLGSSNGTLVQFRGEREILDGDLFRIGHHLFRFDIGARAASGGGSAAQ
jgi:pSer/pThr/pTyr-binding forkhead associated (FHA) protein